MTYYGEGVATSDMVFAVRIQEEQPATLSPLSPSSHTHSALSASAGPALPASAGPALSASPKRGVNCRNPNGEKFGTLLNFSGTGAKCTAGVILEPRLGMSMEPSSVGGVDVVPGRIEAGRDMFRAPVFAKSEREKKRTRSKIRETGSSLAGGKEAGGGGCVQWRLDVLGEGESGVGRCGETEEGLKLVEEIERETWQNLERWMC
ncbi:hypothetical protein Droror1_Dr00017676 [Drosera rotundifolia]